MARILILQFLLQEQRFSLERRGRGTRVNAEGVILVSTVQGGIAGGDQIAVERRIREIINKASSLMEKALYREAKSTLEMGLGFDPQNMGVWERLVVCNLELKKPKAAIEVINRIVKIQPTAVKYWSDKGYLHLLLPQQVASVSSVHLQPLALALSKAKS